MSARTREDELLEELMDTGNFNAMEQLLDEYRTLVERRTRREVAALLRTVPGHETLGADWNWWDAATIPGSCADLIEATA